MAICLKAFKTDPFWQGCTIYIDEAKDSDICPVGLVRLLLQSVSFKKDEPIFQTSTGQGITRECFILLLQVTLTECGVENASAYKGHSFHIGAATTA